MNLDFQVSGPDDFPSGAIANFGGSVAGTGRPCDYQVPMPKPTTMAMPDMVRTAVAQGAQAAGSSPQPGLIPMDFLKPLPSIVNTAPEQFASPCDPISTWVGENPILAAGVLLGLWLVVKGK